MIGGKDLMNKKKYYDRPSALSQIRQHIVRYVDEHLREEFMIGTTDITEQVCENLVEEIYIDTCRAISPAFLPTIHFGDSRLENSEKTFFYKKNNYNLNLMGERIKVKIWIGLPARIARENFELASQKYPEYHKKYHVRTVDNGMYRIECYYLIRGCTFGDMLYKKPGGVWFSKDGDDLDISKSNLEQIEKFRHKNKNGCLITSMKESFITFVSSQIHPTRYGKNVYYPNDCNPGNFVLDYDSENPFPYNCVNMDYDHMIITNPKHMIHNITWQFLSRIFDPETLPDDVAADDVIEWRNSHDLFQEVEQFKSRYLESANIEYKSKEECFKYDITLSSLNGSVTLLDYVNKEKEIFLEKYGPKTGVKTNDRGQEQLYEIGDDSEEDDNLE